MQTDNNSPQHTSTQEPISYPSVDTKISGITPVHPPPRILSRKVALIILSIILLGIIAGAYLTFPDFKKAFVNNDFNKAFTPSTIPTASPEPTNNNDFKSIHPPTPNPTEYYLQSSISPIQ